MKEEISFSGFFFGRRESGETTKFYNDFSAFKVSMLDKISSIDSFPWRNIGSSRGTKSDPFQLDVPSQEEQLWRSDGGNYSSLCWKRGDR